MKLHGFYLLALLIALAMGVLGAAGDLDGAGTAPSSQQRPAGSGDFDCTTAEVPRSECQALVDFYDALDGPGWTHGWSWFTAQPVCDWAGLSCEEVNGQKHITGIMLRDNNLAGQLPGETLAKLTMLQSLNVMANDIGGSIPKEIGELKHLQRLVLGDNTLTGPIPDEIADLPDLTWLFLEQNLLSGQIPEALMGSNCAGCPLNDKYGVLRLFKNDFSGELPSDIGRTDISTLDFRWNQSLEGPIPPSYILLNHVGVFFYFETNVCTPSDPAILAWLDGVASVFGSGLDCDDFDYQISGKIVGSVGQPLEGVTVKTAGGQGSLTDSQGKFGFSASAGAHVITPELQGFSFVPPSLEVTLPPDAADVDFTGYSGLLISGRITDESGTPISDVTVFTQDFDGGITDANGEYVIDFLDAGNYQVEPSDPAYKFTPSSTDVTLPPSEGGVDFVAAALPYETGVTPLGPGWDTNLDPEIAGILADLSPGDTLGYSCPSAAMASAAACQFSDAVVSLQADGADWRCDLVRLRPLPTAASEANPGTYRAWIKMTEPLETGTCPAEARGATGREASTLTFEAGAEAFLYATTDALLSFALDSAATDIAAAGYNTFSIETFPADQKTTIAVYGGRLELTPANPALAPFTLEQGQIVTITADGVSPLSSLHQLYLPQVSAR